MKWPVKKWITQMREGKEKEVQEEIDGFEVIGDDEDGDSENENISTLYEVVEEYLKSLDHNQLADVSEKFVERYHQHTDEVTDIIKVSSKSAVFGSREAVRVGSKEIEEKKVAEVIKDGRERIEREVKGGVMSDDSLKLFLKEWVDIIRVQDSSKFETALKHLDEKKTGEIKGLENTVGLKIAKIESDLSQTSTHHLDLLTMLQNEVHEQNRRLFLMFNRVWILITGLVVATLLGGAALLVAILK